MKTVMILLNGFGVESKKSYPIYNKELMPNLDMLTKNYLFSQLEANVNDIKDGYRDLCLQINEMYNYKVYDEATQNNLFNNDTIMNLKNEHEVRKSKLHVFCFVDNSLKIVEQIKNFVKNMNIDKNKIIYLHIVLTSNCVEDYDRILKILSKINIEIEDYAKIGLVLGLNNISNNVPSTELNFFLRILITEVGEKWQSFSQKIDVSYGMKQLPNMVKAFVVNDGFSIGKDDIFMIWNYDKVDLTNFINLLKQVKYGEDNNNFMFLSLFEIICNEKINSILNYVVAKNSMVDNLTSLEAKALIMANKDDINIINYYANGLQLATSDKIRFIDVENYLFKPNELLNIINTYDDDLMIINYSIESVKTIEELKLMLHNIDIMIGNIYENSKGSKYSIVISSLYGINRVMNSEKGEICNVIFNEKLPIVFIDDFITKKDYLIIEGKVSDILPVCYKKISDKYIGNSIVVKKNFLYKLFFK